LRFSRKASKLPRSKEKNEDVDLRQAAVSGESCGVAWGEDPVKKRSELGNDCRD
jgi:hypothetical protein